MAPTSFCFSKTAGEGSLAAMTVAAGSASVDALVEAIAGDRRGLLATLSERGALLFRGFNVSEANEFERITRALTDSAFSYVGGGSPRSRVKGEVFTSTEYSADVVIPLHNEASYFPELPAYVWFFCATPPKDAGETPLGDMRRVLERLDPALVERFTSRGLCYVSNLHGGKGFGKSWQATYQTDDRAEVEARLHERGFEYSWVDGDTLRVVMRAPVLRSHPVTGKQYWGNQVVNWHDAALPEKAAASVRRLYGDPWNYPKGVFYGDGSPIPAEDVRAVARILTEEETAFRWQAGDVLLVDNRAIAHGRRAFAGERRILVALA